MSELEILIRRLLDENSGGMKFLELVTKIVEESKKINPEIVESLCRRLNGIKVVDYTWKQCNRSKMFICTI